MKPFDLLEPTRLTDATHLLAEGGATARPLAGGSDLLGELKDGICHVPTLVSLARLPDLDGISPLPDGGLRLGARVTLAALEHTPELAGPWRLLAEAARGVATPEIRNQGTLGGNLAQHPRCLHYRSASITCLRKGGAGCPAAESPHQPYLALFGEGPCRAAHPSDLAPVLLALDAALLVTGPKGDRTLPLADFFTSSTDYALRDHTLMPGEILKAVQLPPLPADWRGAFNKARERTAGDFALLSVAFGCRKAGGKMQEVRAVLGSVAAGPVRLPRVEALLDGQAPSTALVRQAADLAFADAQTSPASAYKLPWGRSLMARAIEAATR